MFYVCKAVCLFAISGRCVSCVHFTVLQGLKNACILLHLTPQAVDELATTRSRRGVKWKSRRVTVASPARTLRRRSRSVVLSSGGLTVTGCLDVGGGVASSASLVVTGLTLPLLLAPPFRSTVSSSSFSTGSSSSASWHMSEEIAS